MNDNLRFFLRLCFQFEYISFIFCLVVRCFAS